MAAAARSVARRGSRVMGSASIPTTRGSRGAERSQPAVAFTARGGSWRRDVGHAAGAAVERGPVGIAEIAFLDDGPQVRGGMDETALAHVHAHVRDLLPAEEEQVPGAEGSPIDG